jgi:serine/threonine protein kinase/dipeptidyl aminopeptidase/acylaminoacyl peptidase
VKEARAKTVESIFHEALARPEAEREKYLAEACQGDQELYGKVASLLSAYQDSEGLLQKGLFAQEPEPPTFPEGARIASYRIVRMLGIGGMGEVYEAYDERLKRRVALKTLRPGLAGDAARVERLKREARAASALNHPNILTIYDFGREGDTEFIVSELVEGVSLQRLIGELSTSDALDYARQIGEALKAAHAAGIVHRDIKPENIMVRSDGYIKVLDFGLAKIRLSPPSGKRLDEQLTPSGGISHPGLLIGTINYMSPEQARGQEVDFRTDIWSWGVVLYEMLSGRRPFEGVAAILNQEPKPPSSDQRLNQVVAKALSKRLETRYRGMPDALEALAELQPKAQPWPFWRRALLWSALTLFVASAIGIARYWVRRTSLREPFRVDSMIALTTSGNVTLGGISPDGSYAAYVTEDKLGQTLKLAQLGTSAESVKARAGPGSFWGLTFAPDGRNIYYVVQQNFVGKLYRTSLLGDEAKIVADDVDSPISFSPDGSRFVFVRGSTARHESSLIIKSVASGVESTLMTLKSPDAFESGPIWSLDGASVVCGMLTVTPESQSMVRIVSIRFQDGRMEKSVAEPWNSMMGKPVWIKEGRAILTAAHGISSNRYQLHEVSWPGGDSMPIVQDMEDYRFLDAAADARRIVSIVRHRESSLWTVPLADPTRPRLVSRGKYYGIAWTRSGNVITQTDIGGQPDLGSVEVNTGKLHQITDDPFLEQLPTVSPDGKYVVYTSNRAGGTHLWRSGVDGSNPTQLTSGLSRELNPSVTPDGKWVIYNSSPEGERALWKVSIEGGSGVRLTPPAAYAKQAEVSPNGTWIVCNYAVLPLRKWTAVILRASDGRPIRPLPGIPGDTPVHWSTDGKSLFYVVTVDGVSNIWNQPAHGGAPRQLTHSVDGVSNIWNQPAHGGAPRQLTHFMEETIFSIAASPDGNYLGYVRGKTTSNLVLIQAAR